MDERKIIIIGTGDFSEVVYRVLMKQGREVACFCVDDEYLPGSSGSHPVIGSTEMLRSYLPDEYELVLGFIGKPMFEVRRSKFDELKSAGYSFANVIDCDTTYVAEIGEGNVILQNVSLGYDTHIGDGNIIWQGAVFPHNNHVGNFNNFGPNATLCGYAAVGSHCYVGAGSIIKNRTVVADHTLVGAGAYVHKDTESDQVIVPARSEILANKRPEHFFG